MFQTRCSGGNRLHRLMMPHQARFLSPFLPAPLCSRSVGEVHSFISG